MQLKRPFPSVIAIAIEFIKRNVDLILSLLLFTVIIFTPWWIPSLIPSIGGNILIATISPIAAAVGVLIAHRTNEKLKSPKLTIVSCNFFKYSRSIRVYVEVENGVGREIAKDARPLIIIKKIKNDKEHDLETDDLLVVPSYEFNRMTGEAVHYLIILVPPTNPRVEGEYIPWMVPELSYRTWGLHGIMFKHVTNIAPGQRVRAAIFDVLKYEEKYFLLVFSEYGAESDRSHFESGKVVRVLRCILRPGRYRFYLSISADKTYPAKALLEVDTINTNEIVFKSSRFYGSLNLTELLP
jgi:hypothetical protein